MTGTKEEAMSREYAIKRLKKKEKEDLAKSWSAALQTQT